ncbi:MAG: hypothetical protein Q8940_00585 [Bacteroidota bacterium]|nr:hypothetical protein [Bacteroidota bacterium]
MNKAVFDEIKMITKAIIATGNGDRLEKGSKAKDIPGRTEIDENSEAKNSEIQSQSYNEKSCARLFEIFSSVTEINNNSCFKEDFTSTILKSGKAISPIDAGTCILDSSRTAAFIRATYEAIERAKEKFRGDLPIRVLYAGCGPFAPFATALSTVFSQNEVLFTVIDIHRRSIESVKKIVTALGIEDNFSDIITSDATNFKSKHSQKYHVLIVEVMQRALSVEPQVAIMANLIPQLIPGGYAIPKEISVEAYLGDPNLIFSLGSQIGPDKLNKLEKSNLLRLGKVLDISPKLIRKMVKKKVDFTKSDKPILRSYIFIPAQKSKEIYLMLFTRVELTGQITLERMSSGITIPVVFTKLGPFKESEFIEFGYTIDGDKTGIRYRAIRKESVKLKIKGLLNFVITNVIR